MTKSFRVFSFILLMSLSSNLYAWDLAPLASLKGAAIVTGVYGATNGISNWIGGFRWNKHAGLSDETTATIQETAWLSAAVESWTLGFIVPLIVYQYTRKQTAAPSVGDFIWELPALATPKGVAIVTAVYGATNGISNWIGGYRWNKHAGFSDETTAVIQEVGWLTAAVESWVLCLIIPLMVYQFNKKFPTPSQESFGEFDDSL